MKRRGFILTAGLSTAGAIGWPELVSRAFAQDRIPEDGLLAGVSEAYRAAQRASRPLLVLVIPADEAARWERGTALGAFLNHGPDDAMAAVGLAEVTCAPMSALRRLVPQAPPGEPLMVLVDTSAVPAIVTALDAPLPAEPPFPEDMWSEGGGRERYYVEVDARIDTLIATVAQLLNGALGSRVAALGVADRQAALERAVDTYRAHRVRGSYWASQAGCGVHIEEVPTTGAIGCGMGHTPERARRFLYFFAPAGNPI